MAANVTTRMLQKFGFSDTCKLWLNCRSLYWEKHLHGNWL